MAKHDAQSESRREQQAQQRADKHRAQAGDEVVGETVEHAAHDPKQSAEARDKHNTEHVGGEFKRSCYFCTAQRAGSSVPVQVRDDPPEV